MEVLQMSLAYIKGSEYPDEVINYFMDIQTTEGVYRRMGNYK